MHLQPFTCDCPAAESIVEDTVLFHLDGLDILDKTVRVYFWTLIPALFL